MPCCSPIQEPVCSSGGVHTEHFLESFLGLQPTQGVLCFSRTAPFLCGRSMLWHHAILPGFSATEKVWESQEGLSMGLLTQKWHTSPLPTSQRPETAGEGFLPCVIGEETGGSPDEESREGNFVLKL